MAQHEAQRQNDDAANQRCRRCDGWLIGNERRGETCNRCLELGYEGMTDEEYDAIPDDGTPRS